MKRHSKVIAIATAAALLIAAVISNPPADLTFEGLKENSADLSAAVRTHYFRSLILFGIALMTTAFFVPGALILTVSGGFLFGAARGALYGALFLTAGSVLAFLLSRYLIGEWIQQRYEAQLRRFNGEVARHGVNYLFILRIIPIMPAFLVNYLSGLTRMSTVRFAVVSFLGILPGAAVYSLAGRQLTTIESPEDILSASVLIGFGLLVIFALLPVLYAKTRR